MSDGYNTPFNRDQQRRRRRLIGEAGKGDKRRPTNESAYSAGMRLIKVADKYGKDSDEYTQALAEWRAATKEGR